MFTFTIYPEANFIEKAYLDDGEKVHEWLVKKLNSQEILDFAYSTAIEKGADAITHFKIKNVFKIVDDGVENVPLQGLEVEGLLIKRK